MTIQFAHLFAYFPHFTPQAGGPMAHPALPVRSCKARLRAYKNLVYVIIRRLAPLTAWHTEQQFPIIRGVVN